MHHNSCGINYQALNQRSNYRPIIQYGYSCSVYLYTQLLSHIHQEDQNEIKSMKESIYPGTWSKSKDFISIPRKMEPSSCSVILDSCACLTMIKDIKSTKMTCQDNKRGFLGDQHLSSELLLLSVVFLFLSEIAPSNKDYIFFSVSHASFFFFLFP